MEITLIFGLLCDEMLKIKRERDNSTSLKQDDK
jgi:hypothetical protein